jgi:uracil-DNA glycosylase family 4
MNKKLVKNIISRNTYDAFATALKTSNCNQCALSESRQNIVVDRGNPQAKVLIIGEAPGKNEDETGQPFVGRAGKMLDEMMRTINFDTQKDALIANIVKCRPPENRVPKQKEVEACLPFLHRQIELLKPKTIILLGATAFKRILPDVKFLSMTDIVGKVFTDEKIKGAKLVTLFHPAYLLYDPRKKEEMKKHLKQLRAKKIL